MATTKKKATKATNWLHDNSPAGIRKRERAQRKRLRTRRRNERLRKKRAKLAGIATNGGTENGSKRSRSKGSQHLTNSSEADEHPEYLEGAALTARLNEERQVGALFGETWKTIELRARGSRVPISVLAGRLGRLLLGAARGPILGD